MSRTSEQRENFVAAIKALVPADPSTGNPTFDVLPSSSVKAALNRISRRKGIYVVYGGNAPAGLQFAGSEYKRTKVEDTWYVVIVAESYRSLEDAFSQAGGCDAMLDVLFAARGADISDTAHANQVRVRYDGLSLEEGEVTPDGGGTVGYVAIFHSSQYVV